MPLSDDAKRYCEELFEARQTALIKERKDARKTVRRGLVNFEDAEKHAGYLGVLQPEIDFGVGLNQARMEALRKAFAWDGQPLTEEIIAGILTEADKVLQESLAAMIGSEKGRMALLDQRTGKIDPAASSKLGELSRHVSRTISETRNATRNDLFLRMFEGKKPDFKSSPDVPPPTPQHVTIHQDGSQPRVNVNSEDRSVNKNFSNGDTLNRRWSRNEKLTLASVAVAAIAIVAAFVIPEGRRFFGLDKPNPISHVQSPPIRVAAPQILPEPKLDLKPATPVTHTKVTGENIAGNAVAGQHNTQVNQTSAGSNSPNVSAPNGIAIAGGNVTNPTVNNFGPPSRRLSDEQRNALIPCLGARAGTFTVSAIANNGEAYRYALDWSEVLTTAGWKNEQLIPVTIFMIGGGMWKGVRISIFGNWDDTTQHASLVEGSPEMVATTCVMKAPQLSGVVIP